MVTEIYNTFLKGLDTDTNPVNYSNDNYYSANNFRLIVDEELSSLTLTNGKGLELTFTTYPNKVGTVKIKGACEIDENLILFVGNGEIHVIPIASLNTGTIIDLTATTTYRIVNKAFAFGDRVIAIPKHERTNLRKVYWADGDNPVRVINIDEDDTTLDGMAVGEFALVRRCLLSTPELESVTGGSLKSGVYRYAYCLFDEYAGQTSYSSLSQAIPVVSEDFVDATSNKKGWTFRGEESGVTTSKGLQIKITQNTNLSTHQEEFSNIRVVSLYYTSQTSIPEVTIIYEGLNVSEVYVEDMGTLNLGTLAYEEFTAMNMYLIPQTIETKNNYLFFGNVTESAYDVDYDARAYRFNSDGEALIWDASDFSVDAETDVSDYDVDEDADCANKYNVLDYDSYTGNTSSSTTPRVTAEDCKYQSDGETLGGEGLNIAYEFITDTITGGDPANSNQPYLNPTDYISIGYQRDEIYRFGIRLFNTYGEGTFVKWIGDIRFPSVEEKPIYNSGTGYINILGIKFTVSNLPTGVTGYQIVRATRNTGDQTVVDTGYIGHLQIGDSNIGYYFGGTYNSYSSTKDSNLYSRPKLYSSALTGAPQRDIVEYISPETTYNNIASTNYNRIDSYEGTNTSDWLRTGLSTPYDNDNVSLTYLTQAYDSGETPIVTKIKTIDCFKYSGVHDDDYSVIMGGRFGSIKLNSESNNNDELDQYNIDGVYAKGNRGVKGTTLLLNLVTNLTKNDDNDYLNYPAYALRRNHIKPYGGFTYGAIQATEYIPCTSIQDSTTSYVDTWGGDTFITWYDYLRVGWYDYVGSKDEEDTVDKYNSNKYAQIVRCLVESKINLTYTVSPTILYYNLFTQATANLAQAEYDYLAMWETAGSYLLADDPAGDADRKYFEQDFNMYTYNPVFSALNYATTYIAKPNYFSETNVFPNRIYRSDKKIDGAVSDNWGTVKAFNFLDVDSSYGEITRLYTHNNTLLCFQPKGISVLPIEEREQVSTTSGSSVAIGTGDVLSRYDYLSNTSGTAFHDSIVGTNNGIYYVDGINKKIAVLAQGVQFISDTKKIMSYTANKDFSTAVMLYNPKYSELWINIDDDTIIFNEYLGYFTSTLDTTFEFGFTINGLTHCVDSVTRGIYTNSNMLILDQGNYGAYDSSSNYYNTELTQPTIDSSEIKFVVNPANGMKNRFDSIDLNTYTYVDDVNASHSYTFNGLVAKTLYQTCTQTSLHANAKRRFGTWRYNNLRGDSNDRLHDNYLKLELTFSPTTIGFRDGDDVKFVVNGISTNFIPTFIR